MAVLYEIKERRVIPNWRDFKRTLQLGELTLLKPADEQTDINIDRALRDWRDQKNIGTAADLINSAFISNKNDSQEVNEAIQHIFENKNQASKSLIKLVELISSSNVPAKLSSSNFILEKDVETIEEFQAFINNKVLFKLINKTKRKARNEVYNPIVWVELARLYIMHGQEKKAEAAILSALYLAPNNRFVLRSATRFFIHTDKLEKAIYYLRKSDSIKNDPWLISAHIATSSIMGRFSPFIKDGNRLIESRNFSPNELTELASSIGTLEFNDGSFKKAKELFHKSMIAPNDNSLAQLEWVSKEDSRFHVNPFEYKKVINPFEAYAFDHFENGNWRDAFYNCIKWFLDVPFSKRPVLLGSYLAGSLLQDKNAAIILCQVGLQANPHDPNILNNLIFDLMTVERYDDAEKYIHQLKEIDLNKLDDENKIMVQATLGLVALRSNEKELGKQLYELAISNSEKIKSNYLINLAVINYARELLIANQPEKDKYSLKVKEMKIDPKHKDLIIQRENFLSFEKAHYT